MVSKLKIASIIALLFFASNGIVSADTTETIRVKGFGPGRTNAYLAGLNGELLLPPFFRAATLYNRLKMLGNFGPSGVVPCAIDIHGTIPHVHSGTLVDSNNELNADVFFAPSINSYLSLEEAQELANFVKNGGVLYVGGSGAIDSEIGNGPEYNLLFETLGIKDRFTAGLGHEGNPLNRATTLESLVTRGPFGDIEGFSHQRFRGFSSQFLKGTVLAENGEHLIHEGRVGRGYLVVAGSTFYTDFWLQQDLDMRNYYLNLFALGCDKSWQDNSVVLDVPSFKQGLPPYDGADPYWENFTYNHGDKLPLPDCNRNGDNATIAECGCALTSASMVMKYHGVNLSPGGLFPQNPAFLNLFANGKLPDSIDDAQGFYGGQFNWYYAGNFSAVAAEDNKDEDGNKLKVELESRENFSVDRVKQLIDAGKPVIVKVVGRWGIHWVVVKGYDPDTDRLIINDPAKPDPEPGEYTYLDESYAPAAGNSMVVYRQTNSDFRRLQFATVSQNHLLVIDEFGNKTGYDPETRQIVEQIPNSEYILDEHYGDATSTEELPPANDGIYFLTIKLPEDGEYKLQIFSQDGEAYPVQVYSSDTKGALSGGLLNPGNTGNSYKLNYVEETAGEGINVSIDARIDIIPFLSSNTIIPHKWIPASVAILASDTFDVTKIDQQSLTFGKTGEEESLISCGKRLIDVNRDKKKDLVCYFYGDKLGLDTGDTMAILKGEYEHGFLFSATDTVKIFKPWFLF